MSGTSLSSTHNPCLRISLQPSPWLYGWIYRTTIHTRIFDDKHDPKMFDFDCGIALHTLEELVDVGYDFADGFVALSRPSAQRRDRW